jgi:multisubunit Na+/H+ antiporter MnhC subunit
MSAEMLEVFRSGSVFIILLFAIGVYWMIGTYNIVRVLIAIELLIKAATLLIILAGFVSGHTALAQALVITTIVIEVVVMTIAMGIVLGIHRHTHSLDSKRLRRLRG